MPDGFGWSYLRGYTGINGWLVLDAPCLRGHKCPFYGGVRAGVDRNRGHECPFYGGVRAGVDRKRGHECPPYGDGVHVGMGVWWVWMVCVGMDGAVAGDA